MKALKDFKKGEYFTLKNMETYYIGGYQYGITDYHGTHCVVDCDEYEFGDCLDRAIEFIGSYEKCCEYRKQQEINYVESLF